MIYLFKVGVKMEDNIKQLKEDYKISLKRSNTKEEKQHIKKDYKKMKSLIKNSNKLLKESEKEQKKWDKVWDKMEREYEKLGQPLNCDIDVEKQLNNKIEIEKDITKCIYQDDKSEKKVNTKRIYECSEIIENNSINQDNIKKLFEKDSNEAYIRLIIPYDFVRLILPEYKSDMDLRGKKDLDLTTDEVIVLKKYNFEYFQDIL